MIGNLEQALQTFVAEGAGKQGAGDGNKALQQRLERISRQNSQYFNTATAMLVAAFAAELALVSISEVDKTTMQAVVGGFGATIVGMVWMMLKFWREKNRTEVILALAGIDPSLMREVAVRFLDSVAPARLAPSPSSSGTS